MHLMHQYAVQVITLFSDFASYLHRGGYVIIRHLSVCLLATLHKNYRPDLHENFTTDVSLGKQVLIKVQKSSGFCIQNGTPVLDSGFRPDLPWQRSALYECSCLYQGRARDVKARDRDETDTLASPAERRPRRDVCSSRDVIETLEYKFS